MKQRKIGLIVNPIAGMGGKTALRGTDGSEILQRAIALGAHPEAEQKAIRALTQAGRHIDGITVYTCSGSMGEHCCKAANLLHHLVYQAPPVTTPQDTRNAAQALLTHTVDLIVFAGGDGTARDIFNVVGEKVPVLGIPAGVKIQSAVFAVNPEAAGRILALFCEQKAAITSREVVDLDEELYRQRHISARLFGYMKVPEFPSLIQSMKVSGHGSDAQLLCGAANYIVEHMEDEVCYAVGAGTSAKAITDRLGVRTELLGIDIIKNRILLQQDVSEQELFALTQKEQVKIVISPIGGQGFIFGRGNHQFSSRVLRNIGKNNVILISTQQKLISVNQNTLKIDSGDRETDQIFSGYYKVVCGYGYHILMKCE